MGVITKAHVEKGIPYDDYRKLIDDKFAIGQTTGVDHSESMLNYTKLNIQRMNKWDKVTKLGDETVSLAEKLDRPQYWMLLTEGWCGDAAQCTPFIQKVASLNENIQLKIILRDENPEVMDAYLTEGGRSIPKLIILDAETLEEIYV
ncbi:MAG: thioredoxin family protein, partial [Bacteroidota bacterium]